MIRFILLTALILGTQPAAAENRPSASLLGPLGLNTIPSARMEKQGTIRVGVSTADPYAHSYLSIQPADFLNITLRQSAEISSLRDDAKRLYPGVDLKFRLLEEGKYYPELSFGILSAFGHKRMAGEYMALTKRYNNFEFTGGMGWGRYAGSGTFENPLGLLGDHFNDKRAPDGEMPNGPEDWFTGDKIGLFGGVEYFTPINGLSIKADWGADRYIAEKTAFDFDAPAPWSVGVHYAPTGWVDMGIGVLGGDKVMATLSFQNNLKQWPGRRNQTTEPAPMRPERSPLYSASKMAHDAARHGSMILYDIRRNVNAVWTKLDLAPGDSVPKQLGRAARNIANHAGADAEEILITPESIGLSGPTIRVMRRDMEQAIIRRQGSPQEIWRNAKLDTATPPGFDGQVVNVDHFGFGARERALPRLRFILDTQTSLSEEDEGILYRTSAILDGLHQISRHWVVGGAVRLNGPDNLDKIASLRPPSPLPVRSDVARFADKTVTIDRLYNGYLRSLGDGEWHVMAAGGYLEEMYAGLGGEILYRPFGKTYAFGAELWQAFRRDPDSNFALALNGDRLLSGHLKAWYEIPQTDLTIGLKAGRYLAEDMGGTLSLSKSMENGIKLEAFTTATNNADFDLFGGTTHLYSGLRLTLPLGNAPILPDNSQIRLTAAPLGRDTGQSIDNPLPLYDLTTPLSYRAITRDWNDVVE